MVRPRRIHPRISTNVNVEYEEFERFHPDKILNLSAGGAFILTPKPLPLKRHFCFKFTLPELPQKPFRACASVVWSPGKADGSHHPMGMGIEFDFADRDNLRLLDQYVTVQMALRNVDTRIGKELPTHLRSELPDPKKDAFQIEATDLLEPAELPL
jgi:uncharacterized protein (TIGR02266 family)